jgi:hypothetical protein
MFRRTFLAGLTAIALFACTALTASAQTVAPAQPGSGKLTAERAAELLKSKVQSAPDGSKTVAANITYDGKSYEVIVVFLPDGKVFDLYTPVTGANPKLSNTQIQGLQKVNEQLKAEQKAFVLNNQDNRLWFANINFRTDVSEQVFMQELGNHCRVLRDTHDLYKQ